MSSTQLNTGINAWVENTMYTQKHAGVLDTIGKGISRAGKFMQRTGQQAGKFVKNNFGNTSGSIGKPITNFIGKHRMTTGAGIIGSAGAAAYGGYKMLSGNNNNQQQHT